MLLKVMKNMKNMKNSSQKLKKDEVLVARTICNLHSCYNFALALN